MKKILLMLVAFLFIVAAHAQTKVQCESNTKWHRLMDKGKYEEAYKYAMGTKSEWHICTNNFRAEPLFQLGRFDEAVKTATENFHGVGEAGFPEIFGKIAFWCIEYSEREFAAGNINNAYDACDWVLTRIRYDFGTYQKYKGRDKVNVIAELMGDIFVKKENYDNALKYYTALDSTNYKPGINDKIASTKQLQIPYNEKKKEEQKAYDIAVVEEAKKKAIEAKEAEQKAKEDLAIETENKKQKARDYLLPAVSISGFPVASAAIDKDINDNYSDKSKLAGKLDAGSYNLAFSENNEELFFGTDVNNKCQVWNVNSKQKTQEVDLSENNNKKAKEIQAALLSTREFFRADKNAPAIKTALTSDLNLEINQCENFIITNNNNEKLHTFFIGLEKPAWNKLSSSNIRLQLYFNKKLNTLFIISTKKFDADDGSHHVTIASYNLSTQKETYILQSTFAVISNDGSYKPFQWEFVGNYLVNYATSRYNSTHTLYDLDALVDEQRGWNLGYTKSNIKEFTSYERNISNILAVDNNNNLYALDVKYKDGKETNVLRKHAPDKSITGIVKIESTDNLAFNKYKYQNLAVSPSGRYLAFYQVYQYPIDKGNNIETNSYYATICIYDLKEPNKLYTLNDNNYKFYPIEDKQYNQLCYTEAALTRKANKDQEESDDERRRQAIAAKDAADAKKAAADAKQAEYDKIYGVLCPVCNGKGVKFASPGELAPRGGDWSELRQVIGQNVYMYVCLKCNGEGRIKK